MRFDHARHTLEIEDWWDVVAMFIFLAAVLVIGPLYWAWTRIRG